MLLSHTKERILGTQASASSNLPHTMALVHNACDPATGCMTNPETCAQAKVHPYFPYFHVDVLALVFVFKPAAGAPIGEEFALAVCAFRCPFTHRFNTSGPAQRSIPLLTICLSTAGSMLCQQCTRPFSQTAW